MLSRLLMTPTQAALAVMLMLAPASALESTWIGSDTDKAKLRLLAAGASSGEPLRAGLEIRLAPGWYTYWRYPGDAGLPPQFDWSGSTNVEAVEVRWPAPKRISIGGGQYSIGYYDEVVLPLRIRSTDARRPVKLRLSLVFGVCETICIPAQADLALEIPATLDAKVPALDAAEARVPAVAQAGNHAPLSVLKAKLEPGQNPRALVDVTVPPGKPFDLFAEGPADGWALPLPEYIDTADGTRFAIPIDGAPVGADPIPSKLRLTLVAGDEAIEVETPLD